MKKSFLVVIVVSCFLISFTFYNIKCKTDVYPVIKKGINKREAIERIEGDQNYYIIQPELWTTSRGWKIIRNEKITDKIEDVEVIGNDFRYILTSMVLLNEKNTFLVYGDFDKREKSLRIESWEFITPIIRDYEHKNKGASHRKKYPKGFVDQFDVDNGDYKPE